MHIHAHAPVRTRERYLWLKRHADGNECPGFSDAPSIIVLLVYPPTGKIQYLLRFPALLRIFLSINIPMNARFLHRFPLQSPWHPRYCWLTKNCPIDKNENFSLHFTLDFSFEHGVSFDPISKRVPIRVRSVSSAVPAARGPDNVQRVLAVGTTDKVSLSRVPTHVFARSRWHVETAKPVTIIYYYLLFVAGRRCTLR